MIENNLIMTSNGQYIEICEMPEEEVAGRVKIKMSALAIHPDNSQYNSNGITWLEQYINDNLKSAIGMPYVVSWFDEENQIPSDHGTMSYDEEGYVEFEGVSVGSVQDAYIEDIEIDGETKKLLVTEGYLYKQRYGKFVDWLKEELSNGKVYGSIEINGKGKNKNIEYLDGAFNEDGTKKIGRIPTIFDFSGLAILYLTEPSDKSSIVFEVNTKEGDPKKMKVVSKGKSIELNKMSYEDICALITRAFNKTMNPDKNNDYYYDYDYYIHKFYPETNEVVFTKWGDAGNYYMITYKIENTSISISDVIQVEEDWKPTSDSSAVEVNINKIKERIKKEGGNTMDLEKQNKELQEKIAELNKQMGELNAKVAELNSTIEQKDKIIEEKENKVAEVNEALATANKTLEEKDTKCQELEAEVNTFKEEKEKAELEQKKTEVNTYFNVEIPKNKFEEAEVNSLKEYVEKCDLEGLKRAEADLIVKKFKEGKLEVETNAQKDSGNVFFSTKEEKLDDVEAGRSLFV